MYFYANFINTKICKQIFLSNRVFFYEIFIKKKQFFFFVVLCIQNAIVLSLAPPLTFLRKVFSVITLQYFERHEYFEDRIAFQNKMLDWQH